MAAHARVPPLSAPVSILVFALGVVLAIWATERLLEGLVGLSRAAKLSTFAVGALLSGFEVENVAVGLAAGAGVPRTLPLERSSAARCSSHASRSASAECCTRCTSICDVDPLVRILDWPAVVVATLIATGFLARGRIGRVEGAILLVAYTLYVVGHVLLR